MKSKKYNNKSNNVNDWTTAHLKALCAWFYLDSSRFFCKHPSWTAAENEKNRDTCVAELTARGWVWDDHEKKYYKKGNHELKKEG